MKNLILKNSSHFLVSRDWTPNQGCAANREPTEPQHGSSIHHSRRTLALAADFFKNPPNSKTKTTRNNSNISNLMPKMRKRFP